MPGSSNEPAKCGGLSEAASGSQFTLTTEQGRALSDAGISLDDYQDRARQSGTPQQLTKRLLRPPTLTRPEHLMQ